MLKGEVALPLLTTRDSAADGAKVIQAPEKRDKVGQGGGKARPVGHRTPSTRKSDDR